MKALLIFEVGSHVAWLASKILCNQQLPYFYPTDSTAPNARIVSTISGLLVESQPEFHAH